jgi:hypothetical protein
MGGMLYQQTRIIEFRHKKGGVWTKSAMSWLDEEVHFLNKVVGYDKYRVRYESH